MAVPIYQCSPPSGTCLCQGEILSGLIRYGLDLAAPAGPEPNILTIEYPYAVVLTQLCDLTQDFNGRKKGDPQLPNLLFCHVPTALELRNTPGIVSDIWKRIRQNKDERYHFLEKIPLESDQSGEGIPELGIDFRRYFTVPTEEVYRQIELEQAKRRVVICTPYLEHLSSRFAYFLSRVALPRDHESD